jgi:hypothetical protein
MHWKFLLFMFFVHASHCPRASVRLRFDVNSYNLPVAGDLVLIEFGVTKSTVAFDKICSQDEDDEQMVSAAINTQTQVALTWNEYINGPGKNGDRNLGFAKNQWDTFRGSCRLKAKESWAKSDVQITGGEVENRSLRNKAVLPLEIRVTVEAIRCETKLPWWENQFGNFDHLRLNFTKQMRGLDQSIWLPWKGLLLAEDTTFPLTLGYPTPPCHAAWLASTTVQRYVTAYAMFEVEQYNMVRNDGFVGSKTWENMGDGWQNVYINGNPITCHASTSQGPMLEPLFHAQPMERALPESVCS